MQVVFAGQEEEEKRGTQVEIEVRAFCVEAQSYRGGWKLVISGIICCPSSIHPSQITK